MEVEREQHKRCDVVLGSDVYSQIPRAQAVSWRYCFVLNFAGQGCGGEGGSQDQGRQQELSRRRVMSAARLIEEGSL